MGFYFHSLFPRLEVFKSLPYHQELLQSIMLCDLICFHHIEIANKFLSSIQRMLDLYNEVKPEGNIIINYQGKKVHIHIKQIGIDLEKIITGASSEAIDLIRQMLNWDANKRATAKALLKHPFFTNHTINSYFYTEIQSDIFFGDNNVKKYSNNDNNTKKSENKKTEKLNNNNNDINDSNDNNFGIEDDDNNYGIDKLINKLKEEKIEDDKNYEKEKNKYDEEDYDINNFVDNYHNENETKFTKEKKKDINLFDDDIFGGEKINSDSKPYEDEQKNKKEDYSESNKDYNISNQNDHDNSDNKKKQPNKNSNRRGNARNFLDQYENSYNSKDLNYNFNNMARAKTNIETSNSNNFNIGDNGSIGSLFGIGSRRRHDKNYEI
jgi:hypothetical protein